jgi:hypothetical protein
MRILVYKIAKEDFAVRDSWEINFSQMQSLLDKKNGGLQSIVRNSGGQLYFQHYFATNHWL